MNLDWYNVRIGNRFGRELCTRYGCVNDRDMKLGIVPLWSAYMELSNDVLKMNFNFGHILPKIALDQRL